MKALIADDNATNRRLLTGVLESDGVMVSEAAYGVAALKILEREQVDVVISDVLMPNKDGFGRCYELRRRKKFEDLPFIFYTNTCSSASSEKLAFNYGANGFIKKPAEAEAIVEDVRNVMESRVKASSGIALESFPGDLNATRQYRNGIYRLWHRIGDRSAYSATAQRVRAGRRKIRPWSRFLFHSASVREDFQT